MSKPGRWTLFHKAEVLRDVETGAHRATFYANETDVAKVAARGSHLDIGWYCWDCGADGEPVGDAHGPYASKEEALDDTGIADQ